MSASTWSRTLILPFTFRVNYRTTLVTATMNYLQISILLPFQPNGIWRQRFVGCEKSQKRAPTSLSAEKTTGRQATAFAVLYCRMVRVDR
jgi:hypothetical protein